MKTTTEYVPLEIIDDSSDEEGVKEGKSSIELGKSSIELENSGKKQKMVKPKKQPIHLLKGWYQEDPAIVEIGVDEAGRGPLLGRVYAAAVALPKDGSFDCTMVKDSKKYHSKKKIEEAAEYIKHHALAWHVSFEDERVIDEINILQATQSAMHKAIQHVQAAACSGRQPYLLIDGNYFKPITSFNKTTQRIESVPYMTVEGGDNTYASIAAASILAKVSRDQYIEQLCEANPELAEHYGIDSNKGYGAKKHLDGIKQHGITIWHRRSFAPCKFYL